VSNPRNQASTETPFRLAATSSAACLVCSGRPRRIGSYKYCRVVGRQSFDADQRENLAPSACGRLVVGRDRQFRDQFEAHRDMRDNLSFSYASLTRTRAMRAALASRATGLSSLGYRHFLTLGCSVEKARKVRLCLESSHHNHRWHRNRLVRKPNQFEPLGKPRQRLHLGEHQQNPGAEARPRPDLFQSSMTSNIIQAWTRPISRASP
jgi:hypothetical protein